MSNAVLWQHVFQVVVGVLGAVQLAPDDGHSGARNMLGEP